MFCFKCGQKLPSDRAICPTCRSIQPLIEPTKDLTPPVSSVEPAATTSRIEPVAVLQPASDPVPVQPAVSEQIFPSQSMSSEPHPADNWSDKISTSYGPAVELPMPSALPHQVGQPGPLPQSGQLMGYPPIYPNYAVRPPKQKSRFPVWAIVLICSLVVVLLLCGGSFFVLSSVVRSEGQRVLTHVRATETTQSGGDTSTGNNVDPQQLLFQSTSGQPSDGESLAETNGMSWMDGPGTANSSCAFKEGAYYITINKAQSYRPCYALASSESNFALQVDMKVLQGKTGGVIFRANPQKHQFYMFTLSTDKFYTLTFSPEPGKWKDLKVGLASNVKPGSDQTDQVTIIARNQHIYLYVNHNFIAQVTDSTYSSGQIALLSYNDAGTTEVAYSNLKIWHL